MAYLHTTYQDIADILDRNDNRESLSQKLSNNNYDWDMLVKVGSKQLVLPAMYCNLKQKDLLQHLPEDLQTFLDEITTLNRNRNKTILEEVNSISALFKTHNMDYVFLKGTALLVSGYYKDIGERMVGDVDILVHPDQLLKAQEILVNNGYTETDTTFGQDFFEHKHLARLIPTSKLAAVEVHRKLLHKNIKNTLEPLSVLQNKQEVNGIAICGDNDLLLHAVLNFQINDYGSYFNYLGFRNAYDVMVLFNTIQNPQWDAMWSQPYIGSFFDKMTVYFKLEMSRKKSLIRTIKTQIFILKQQNKFLNKVSYFGLKLTKNLGIIIHRIFVFLGNSAYRKESLRDYKRIVKLLKKLLSPF